MLTSLDEAFFVHYLLYHIATQQEHKLDLELIQKVSF